VKAVNFTLATPPTLRAGRQRGCPFLPIASSGTIDVSRLRATPAALLARPSPCHPYAPGQMRASACGFPRADRGLPCNRWISQPPPVCTAISASAGFGHRIVPGSDTQSVGFHAVPNPRTGILLDATDV